MTIISADGRFEWDADKCHLNKRKHGLYFDEIIEVFDDPCFIEFYDRDHSLYEDRYRGLGCIGGIAVISIVFSIRNRRIRVISARTAMPKERMVYYEYIEKAIR